MNILKPFEVVGNVLLRIFSSKENTTDGTEAPELKPYNNRITASILILVIALIGTGIILMLRESFWGVVLCSLGAVIWWAGDTKIKADPRTAMALTWWDSFITLGGKPVVVGGRTILANYFPFYLSGVEFEITNVDKDFKVDILSSDNVPLDGIISVTLRPNIRDAIDYIQAGKMENIILQLDDIIYEKAKAEGRKHKAEDIAKQSELISGPIREKVDNILEEESFGIERKKVQAKFDMPKDIIAAMKQKVTEHYQRLGEHEEYRTDIDAAKELQAEYRKDPSMKVIPTTEQCLQEIKTLRLIRDERVARIETSGNVGTVIVTDTKLNMGSQEKDKKTK